jgi:hypothetical protein
MFRKNISFPSSLSKSKPNKKSAKTGGKPSPISPGFLILSLFNPEDGGDIFFRNVGLSPNYTALQPGEPKSVVTLIIVIS